LAWATIRREITLQNRKLVFMMFQTRWLSLAGGGTLI